MVEGAVFAHGCETLQSCPIQLYQERKRENGEKSRLRKSVLVTLLYLTEREHKEHVTDPEGYKGSSCLKEVHKPSS